MKEHQQAEWRACCVSGSVPSLALEGISQGQQKQRACPNRKLGGELNTGTVRKGMGKMERNRRESAAPGHQQGGAATPGPGARTSYPTL